MSVVESVLREEAQRLRSNIEFYEDSLAKLPRGTIFIRKSTSGNYVYRKRKENGSVVCVYLGKESQENVKQEMALSEDYKRIHNNLLIAKKELRKLEKALKSYERK